MSNTFSTQLTQQRITDAGGREFRFRGDLYSQESTSPLVFRMLSETNGTMSMTGQSEKLYCSGKGFNSCGKAEWRTYSAHFLLIS